MTPPVQRADPRVTIAVLALGALAYSLVGAVVLPALPVMQHDLHTSESGVTWVLTAYLLAAAVGTSILGRLGDMHGKERVLLWALVILAVGMFVSAVGHSLGVVVAGRLLQGAAGGVFPLAFGIVRDEFPRERVAGSIGVLSAILGIGSGLGIVGAGFVIKYLNWHWLFWIPLALTVIAALCTWRFVPESPIRKPGRINWAAATLMSIGISAALLAVSEATIWGWGSPKTLGLLAAGLLVCVAWIAVEVRSDEPLVDMTMMRIRGVWTANATAFLLGAGMYAAFVIIPQFAQLPKSTGFGFGASVVQSGLYLLPTTLGMMVMSLQAGRLAARFGSRASLICGAAVTTVAFAMLAFAHDHPYDFLIASTLVGVGIGLSFAALGAIVVGAVPPEQTGIASGMNTVLRTLGGALGGQLAATFVAGHVAHGEPAVTGFIESFAAGAAFLGVAIVTATLVPRRTVAPVVALRTAGNSGAPAVAANAAGLLSVPDSPQGDIDAAARRRSSVH